MKLKSLLSVIFMVLCSISYGQNLVYSPGLFVEGTIEGRVNELSVTVTTPQPEPITFAWKKIKNDFPFDWDFSLCDHNNCYIGLPSSGTMFSISQSEADAGQKGFFKLNILKAESFGSYELQIYVYDKNDINRGDTITFKMTNGIVSQRELENRILHLAPNPASSEFTIDVQEPGTVIEVYSLSGELVRSKTVSYSGTARLSVLDLKDGLYLVKLKSKTVNRQSKLVIAH